MDQLQTQPFGIRVLATWPGVVRVSVIGEVDLYTAPRLERALIRELRGASELLLNLAEVSFIDASGLQAIVAAAHEAEATGGTLAVDSRLPAQARRLIDLTGLEGFLRVG